MIRRTPLVLALLLLSLLGAGHAHQAAAAPKAAGDQTRFYDFDELLIDGEFNKPTTIYTRALKSPRFDRLLRLQKSFLDQLGRTARDPGLRRFR
jgi:hypothetical protein